MVFRLGRRSLLNMIIFLENSNLLDVDSGVIAHGCNAQGVMGSGVAKQLRYKYPEVYTSYSSALVDFGRHWCGAVDFVRVSPRLIVANMITQEYYGRDGAHYVSYAALQIAMQSVLEQSKNMGLDVHIPYMVGAGLGGGDLTKIKSIYEDCSTAANKNIYCHIFKK